MSSSVVPGAYGAADPLFLLLIALALEAYLGGRALHLRGLPNPRAALARLVQALERRLNRPQRGRAERRARGAAVALGLAVLGLAVGWLVEWITRHYPFAWAVELLLLVLLITQRDTWRRGADLAQAVNHGSLIRAREVLRPLVGERLAPQAVDRLGAPEVVEAGIAALGRRFASGLIGPVFWYVVLGLPGLFLQLCARVMAACLSEHVGDFGLAARSLERGLAAVPGYLAGVILAAAAAFVPGGRPLAALGRALKGREGAAAALGAALRPLPGPTRLARALAIFAVACLIDAGLIAALALVRLRL